MGGDIYRSAINASVKTSAIRYELSFQYIGRLIFPHLTLVMLKPLLQVSAICKSKKMDTASMGCDKAAGMLRFP